MKFKAATFAKKRTENNFFKRYAVTLVFVVALFPSFASAFSYDDYLIFTQKAGQTLASGITSSVGKAQNFLVAGTEAATQNAAPTLASVSSIWDNISSYFFSLIKGNNTQTYTSPPPALPLSRPIAPTLPPPPKPATVVAPSSKPVSSPSSQPLVIEKTVERVLSGVTDADLDIRIQQLRNELLAKIGAVAGQSQSNYSNNFQAIALTNKIDQLTNTVINTPTITGGSITSTSISGGTISGTTISGTTLTVSSGIFSGNLTVSGTGTSTFAGDSVFDSDTLYIDSLNNRVGVGTSSPSDTFALNGAAYLAQISAPGVTTNRLYNQGGLLYFNGTAVGSGSGSGSTFSTTTSQVSGQLVNYPLNATDIVAIGASSTTTASFFFDPNTTTGYISGKLGIGTTSPYAKLSVVGEAVAANFTATSTTATSTFMGAVGIGTVSPAAILGIRGNAISSGNTIGGFNETINISSASFTGGSVYGNKTTFSSTNPSVPSPTTIYGNYTSFENRLCFICGGTTFYGSYLDLVTNGSNAVSVGNYVNTDAGNSSKAFYANLNGTNSIGYFATSSGSYSGKYLEFMAGGTDVFTVSGPSGTLYTAGNVGIGTTSPYAKLSVVGEAVASHFTATSTTATSTFTGGLNVGSGNGYFIGGVGILTKASASGSIILGDISGDTRGGGAAALDLQSTRSATNQVASGYEAIAVGNYNRASAINTSAFGYNNAVTGNFSHAFGNGNTVSVATSYAFGGSITNATVGSLMIGPSDAAKLTILSSGNVGIGTTSPSAKLHIGSAASGGNVRVANGWLCVDDNDTCTGATTAGTVYAVGAYTTGADLAENYQAFEEGLTPGDIVSVTDTQTISTTTVDSFGVKKAIQGETVIGIVSTKPGLLLANSLLENIPVALQGRVPVTVNGEGGSIKVGDRITLSSTPGIGMKATTSSYTVGIALESFAGSDISTTGTITAFVNLSWSRLDPAVSNGTIATIEGKESSFWSVEGGSGRIKYIAPVDFNDFDIVGVRAIMGSAGKWSIDGSGKLVVDELQARKVSAQEVTTQIFCVDDVCVDKDKFKAMMSESVREGVSTNIQTQPQDDNPPVASDPEQPATSTASTTSSGDDVSEENPIETSTTDPPVEEATEDIMSVATSSDDYASTTSEAISN